MARGAVLPDGRRADHAGRRQAGAIEPVGHELGVRHRHTKNNGSRLPSIRRQTAPFVDDQFGAHVVAGDQVVHRLAFSRPVPRHFREVGGVVAGVVLKRRQQLQVQRMPQPQLDRRAAVWPRIEILRDGWPSLRSGVAVSPATRWGERLWRKCQTGRPPGGGIHPPPPCASGRRPRWPQDCGWSGCRWWRTNGPSVRVGGSR